MFALAVIEALVPHIRRHPHLKASWLKGSQARGDADRHSDIDLHLWMEPEHADAFRRELPDWLAELYPVVRFHVLYGGHMVGSILQTAPAQLTALDLFIETGDAIELTPGQHRLLWDRDGVISFKADHAVSQEELRRELDVAVRYFWTLFLSLPGIERGELISAVARLSHLTGQLVIVCSLGRGVPRRIGENRGNELLIEGERHALEAVLTLPKLSRDTLVQAHLRLAEMMRVKGRAAAESLGAAYPEELEAAILAHVDRELRRQGIEGLKLSTP